MPGIGGMEWILIGIAVVVLLFGAKKVPELARSIGRAKGEFARGQQDIEKELNQARQITSADQSAPSVHTPVASERVKLEKIASELGIKVEGKDTDQLRQEIKQALGDKN